MASQSDFLELVVDTVEKHCGLSGISMDALLDGCMFAGFDAGYNQSQYYDRSTIRIWPVSFMVKHIEQLVCIDCLTKICNELQKMKKYPRCDDIAWLDASVASYPVRVARQEDGQYIYSCTINMQVYY